MGNYISRSWLVFGFSLLLSQAVWAKVVCSAEQISNGEGTMDYTTQVRWCDYAESVPFPSRLPGKANSQGQPSRQAGSSSNPYAGRSCDSMSPVTFNELRYVTLNLAARLRNGDGSCHVVNSSYDGDALDKCRDIGGQFIINPGNPQYTTKAGLGSRNSNNIGYYFCLKNSSKSFNKEFMCTDIADNEKNKGLSITFVKKSATDGDCMCGSAKSLYKVDCANADLDALAKGDDKCAGEELTENPNKASGQPPCICDTSKGYTGDGKTCQKTAATGGDEASPQLVACVKKYEDEAVSCELKAKEAVKTCDEKNSENPEVEKAVNSAGTVSDLFINKKAGTGLVNECIKAGALARTPKIVLDGLKDSCDANFTECNNLCGEDKAEKFQKECGPLAGTDAASKNGAYYQQHLAVIQEKYTSGTAACKEDASAKRSIFSDVLTGLGESAAAAARCACQVAATAMGTSQSTCSSLPSAEACMANPTLADCPAVIAIDICTQGSPNYSTVGCACQQNPKGEGCAQYVASTPGLSGFAGTDISTPTGNPVNFGVADTPGGGLTTSDLNLGGNTASELASANKTPGITTGFSTGAGGSGSGGIGGGQGGGEGAPGAAGDGEGGGVLGGAFGLAKSIAGALFGGGGNKNNNGTASKTLPNMNKFRPNGTRGVANYEYGGKNHEIWHMMNNRYEYNQTTFLPNP